MANLRGRRALADLDAEYLPIITAKGNCKAFGFVTRLGLILYVDPIWTQDTGDYYKQVYNRLQGLFDVENNQHKRRWGRT